MRIFSALLLAAGCLHEYCASSSAAASAACLRSNPSLLHLLSPAPLTDALALLGPLLLWAPLLRVASAAHHPHTRRAIFVCMLAWLVCIAPIRLTKRAHRALGAPAGALFDPSGHIFLYGMHLLPAWAFAAECAAPKAPALPRLAALLLQRAWSPLLTYLAACTAAFYHSAAEVAAAYAVLLALHWHLAAAPQGAAAAALAAAPPPQRAWSRRALLLAAALAWLGLGAGFLSLLAAAGVEPPRRLHWYALHDAAVLALGLAAFP